MAILDDIQTQFGTIKKVGADGERLAAELKLMLKHMDFVITEFEAGMQSEAWLTNFSSFGGDQAMAWASGVYQELKRTRSTLTQLGL